MSNQITIRPTEFRNIRTGDVTFGYRMYDNYGQTYDNCIFNTKDDIPDDDLELVKMVKDNPNDVAGAMFDYIQENQGDIWVDDEWYEWEKIKHLWDEQE